MFAGFAHVWTPVLLARALRRKPLRVILAGEPLVLFRGEGGRIGALLDRCPHRGVALSLGKINGAGCIECPFHGWQFSPEGDNRMIPLNPDADRDYLNASALPVRQIGDFIWVYTAPLPQAPAEPVVPDGLTAAGLSRTYVQRQWRCHWTRAMENMLDSPHLPFVHRRTIGRTLRQRMTPRSRLEISWEATPFGGRSKASLDGAAHGVTMEFFAPNIMALTIPIPGRHLRIHAIVIPAEEGRTRLVVCGSRDFARSPLLDPMFSLMNAWIADEDRSVVESSGAAPIPPLGAERSVATDRATLQFRKYFHAVLRDSVAQPAALAG